MIILCLGSNVGDRLYYLRAAFTLIQQIPNLTIAQVSPVYISDALLPDNAPQSWNRPYLNVALRCESAITPHALLEQVKSIERKIGRLSEKVWGPRSIDIDILAFDNFLLKDEKLQIPHKELIERPFALWPLADVAPKWIHPQQEKTAAEIVQKWGSRFTGQAPLHTRQIPHRIDTPTLVGILNVTPDSFADGGKYSAVTAAIEHAKFMVASGAEIIDMGAESTRPGADLVTPELEWQRLEPVLTALQAELPNFLIPPKMSVDTRHAEVAKKALQFNIDWINDVSNFSDPEMFAVLQHHPCDVVIMHHLGIPADKKRFLSSEKKPEEHIYDWAETQLELLAKKGLARERIIIDVGIGFGKSMEQDLQLIQAIHTFKDLKNRIMVGHSRKYFLQQFTQKPPAERDLETVLISLLLADQQVDFLRIHNVTMHADAFRVKFGVK